MSETWTIHRILSWTTDYFAGRGLGSPRLDAEVLLADTLGLSRIYLYAHYERPLIDKEREAFRARVKRRAAGEPVAYILGHKEFYSLSFSVSSDVLVPRPETEELVDHVLKEAPGPEQSLRVLDVGTGSGCIAVALAKHLKEAEITAIDVSPAALQIARRNAEAHEVADRISFLEGDLFEPVQGRRFDIVVSNPPYVSPESAELEGEVRRYQPGLALFAPEEGFGIVRKLAHEVAGLVEQGGVFWCEIGHDQGDQVRALGDAFEVHRDLAGHDRFLRWSNSTTG